jgi:hypothetical protein
LKLLLTGSCPRRRTGLPIQVPWNLLDHGPVALNRTMIDLALLS